MTTDRQKTPHSRLRPIPATLSVVLRNGEVLLVRRANPPDAGRWGFPGGKIERGETILAAATRELMEETAVTAKARHAFTALDAFDYNDDGKLRQHFTLIAVLCDWEAGIPIAGDDALEAGWFSISDLEKLNLVMSFGVTDVVRMAEKIMEPEKSL